jgi:gamma-glutamyltranspeptidase / glutathione hydrolase
MAAVISAPDREAPVAVVSLGRAPAAATSEAFATAGLAAIPRSGVLSATSPALIDAWYGLRTGWCRLPLGRLLEPAIAAAERGVAVSGQLARWTAENLQVLDSEFAEIYAPAAGPDAVGSTLRQPGLAALYRHVVACAESPGRFRSEVASRLEAFGRARDAFLRGDDCADHFRAGPAMQARVGDYLISTTGAPTQGPLLLQSLVLYERLRGTWPTSSPGGIHLLAEIFNQAYGWRLRYLTDPELRAVPDPLENDCLDALSQAVNRHKRSDPTSAGYYSEGDTSHFAIIDGHGFGVSWIQSLGLGFGAGCGIADWGLLLCNRLGRSATLNPAHANRCEARKRPVNTIFPWIVSVGPSRTVFGGTPGGDGQLQWNGQTLASMLFDGLDPLHFLSLPRWTSYPGSDKVEHRIPPHLAVDETLSEAIISELGRMGYTIRRKASVGGVSRVLIREGAHCYGLDDGRQEGLTAGY